VQSERSLQMPRRAYGGLASGSRPRSAIPNACKPVGPYAVCEAGAVGARDTS
jgi:hypothetical protein